MAPRPSTPNPNDPQTSDKPWPFIAAVPPGASAAEPPLESSDDAERSRIAAEAYQIAESKGFPENADLEHWLEAERKVKGTL